MVFGQLLPIKPTTNFGRIRRSTGLPFLDPEEFTLYLGFLFTFCRLTTPTGGTHGKYQGFSGASSDIIAVDKRKCKLCAKATFF
jgi:hypothetical protein